MSINFTSLIENIEKEVTEDEIQGKETAQDLSKKRCPFISSFLPIPTSRKIMAAGEFEITGMISPCIKENCMFWKRECLIRKRLE